jgi:hypothetical protein
MRSGHLLTRMLVVLVLLALAASSPISAEGWPARDRSSSARRASDSQRPPRAPRIVVEDDRFHWRDAAVGGAAALGLVLLLAGADVLWARRRERRRLRG